MKYWQCPFCSYWAYYHDSEEYDKRVVKHLKEVHPNEWNKIKKSLTIWS